MQVERTCLDGKSQDRGANRDSSHMERPKNNQLLSHVIVQILRQKKVARIPVCHVFIPFLPLAFLSLALTSIVIVLLIYGLFFSPHVMTSTSSEVLFCAFLCMQFALR